jgi:CrcB protein
VHRPFDYLLLAAAGAAGVLLRTGCSALAARFADGGSAWAPQVATMAVNVLGSFLFGAVYALGATRLGLSPAGQTAILVGLLGGFTTYSTYAFQSVEMLAAGRTVPALTYMVSTNVLVLVAAWAGLRIAGD